MVDGWGIAPAVPANAVSQAQPPFIERAFKEHGNSKLSASGEDVGLPPGQMGNSEIGHLNIGAGKIVWQILTLINRDVRTGDFAKNPALTRVMAAVKASGKPLHVLGLVSDGGVHSHVNHLIATLEAAKGAGIDDVVTHAFLDGRDVPPRSAEKPLALVDAAAAKQGRGRIATIQGRYYAMDRDNRWERTEKAYRVLTEGEGHRASDSADALRKARGRDEGDEFVQPTALEWALDGRRGLIGEGDHVLFFNFRPDRARQLSHALVDPDFSRFARKRVALSSFTTMARFDQFPSPVTVLYPPVEVRECIGSVVAAAGAKQLRLAETEKYAHVTYFINGGREAPYPNEERIMVPSPKVATYDLKPEMSADGITDAAVAGIESGKFRLVIMNYANFDMVGHTGDLKATQRGILSVDRGIERLAAATLARKGLLVVTADHGNAEQMEQVVDGKTVPHTAHTSNPVPLLVIAPTKMRVQDGILADVAPSLLHLIGLKAPGEMTGRIIVDWP